MPYDFFVKIIEQKRVLQICFSRHGTEYRRRRTDLHHAQYFKFGNIQEHYMNLISNFYNIYIYIWSTTRNTPAKYVSTTKVEIKVKRIKY